MNLIGYSFIRCFAVLSSNARSNAHELERGPQKRQGKADRREHSFVPCGDADATTVGRPLLPTDRGAAGSFRDLPNPLSRLALTFTKYFSPSLRPLMVNLVLWASSVAMVQSLSGLIPCLYATCSSENDKKKTIGRPQPRSSGQGKARAKTRQGLVRLDS